jgi:hypothetical protein
MKLSPGGDRISGREVTEERICKMLDWDLTGRREDRLQAAG